MLFQTFISMIETSISGLTGFLDPSATMINGAPALPWGLDNLFVQGVAGYNTLATVFPPFTVALQALGIYLLFRLSMLFVKMIPVVGKAFASGQ